MAYQPIPALIFHLPTQLMTQHLKSHKGNWLFKFYLPNHFSNLNSRFYFVCVGYYSSVCICVYTHWHTKYHGWDSSMIGGSTKRLDNMEILRSMLWATHSKMVWIFEVWTPYDNECLMNGIFWKCGNIWHSSLCGVMCVLGVANRKHYHSHRDWIWVLNYLDQKHLTRIVYSKPQQHCFRSHPHSMQEAPASGSLVL